MSYRQNLMSTSSYTSSGYCCYYAQNESGRSMIEMLGVLAIVGVLSVTGIAGFRRAMINYRSNELLNEASKRAVIVSSQLLNNNNPDLSSFNNNLGFASFSSSVGLDKDNGSFALILTGGVDKDICLQMKKTTGESHSPSIRGECDGNSDIYLAYKDDLSSVDFVFNEDTPPALPEGESCGTYQCHFGIETCGNNGSFDYVTCNTSCYNHVFYGELGYSYGPCETCLNNAYYDDRGSSVSCLLGCAGEYCAEDGSYTCVNNVFYDGHGYSAYCYLGCSGYFCVEGCDTEGFFYSSNGVTYYDPEYCEGGTTSESQNGSYTCINDVFYDGYGNSAYCYLGCSGYFCVEGCDSEGYFYGSTGDAYPDPSYCGEFGYTCTNGSLYENDYFVANCQLGCDGNYCSQGCDSIGDYHFSDGHSEWDPYMCGTESSSGG